MEFPAREDQGFGIKSLKMRRFKNHVFDELV
jgi:hypothetical protein